MYKKDLFILIIVPILLMGCKIGKKDHFERQALKVTVMTVGERTFVSTHTYVGEIEEVSRTPLAAQSAGRVLEVNCKVGQKVNAGDVLVCVDTAQAMNAVRSAEATLSQAEDAYRRVESVYNAGGVSQQQMVEIDTKLQQAKSLASSAEKALSDCYVRAPYAGVIGECDVQKGQTIAPGVPVVTLLDVKDYQVSFTVPESEIATIHIGDAGKLEVPALQSAEMDISVSEKSMLANRIAHTYGVKAIIHHANRPIELMPGMVGKVKIKSQSVCGMVIPAECIQVQLNRGPAVWVIKGNKAERRFLTIGQSLADGVVVIDGIVEGEMIVTDGHQKLYSGAEVEYTIK